MEIKRLLLSKLFNKISWISLVIGFAIGACFPPIAAFVTGVHGLMTPNFFILSILAGIALSVTLTLLYSTILAKESSVVINKIDELIKAIRRLENGDFSSADIEVEKEDPVLEYITDKTSEVQRRIKKILKKEYTTKKIIMLLAKERHLHILVSKLISVITAETEFTQAVAFKKHRVAFYLERNSGKSLIDPFMELDGDAFLFESEPYGEYLSPEDITDSDTENLKFFRFSIADWHIIFIGKSEAKMEDLKAVSPQIKAFFDSAIFYEELQKKTYIDELTGIHNRRYGLLKAREAFFQSKASKRPFTIFLFDLNEFKSINDQFGHEAGDRALKKFAQTINSQIREQDTFARLGGDEFILILPLTGPSGAQALKKRLDNVLDHLFISVEEKVVPIRSSIGSATFPVKDVKTLEELLSIADGKMYLDKENRKARESQ